MRILRTLLIVSLTCGALLLAATEVRANHIRAVEATTDTGTNFILNIPISVQKLPAGARNVGVFCELKAGDHAVLGPSGQAERGGVSGFSKAFAVDGYTGNVSTTLTLRLAVRANESPYTGPLSATCHLGLEVGQDPAQYASETDRNRHRSNVKQGAMLEVTSNFPQ
jgi:hypothetical protein